MIRRGEHTVLWFCKIFFLVLLAVSCVYFLAYQFAEKPIDLDTTNAVVLQGFEAVDRAGNTFTVQTEMRYEYDDNGVFEMTGKLPDSIRDESLCFRSFYDTEVLIGGETVYTYSMIKDAGIVGGAVKAIHHFIELDPSREGQSVAIRQYRGSSPDCRAGTVYFGTVSDIYRLMFRKYGTAFIAGLLMLSLALIILVFGLAMQYRTKRSAGIVSISIGVALTALWIVTDSYFYPFIFGHNHIDGLMSYLVCMLLPCPYLFYADSLQKGRYRKIYTVMQVITLANFFILSVLHFTGLVKFYDSMVVIDVLLVLVIAAIAVILIREFREGYIRTYPYTATGIIGFMLCGFGEILIVLSPDFVNSGAMILIGLMWLLGFAVAQQMEDSRMVDMERQQALELSHTKSAFLASMSHEIRTPINSIMGMNELILRENKDPDIRNYAGTIQRSGRMLLSLINDVLDYSRIEAGKLEIMEEEYRLSELIMDISAIAKERAEQKGLDCDIRIAERIPDGLRSDEVRIKQILLNLLSNAVKYTDEGGIGLTVGGEYSDDETFELKFEVKDTGRGIKAEDQKHLFEAFGRGDLKKNRSIEGTGLGLAIVKSITDSMNGTISVSSEYQKGSVFTVILPQHVVDHSSVPVELKDLRASDRKAARHPFAAPDAIILAVDDNTPNLSIVSAFLKDTKARIDLCTNGKDALTKCREKEYDLILLDHMMPEPDGIQTLEMIRKDPESKNRETKAVVLTANALSGSRQMYMKAGFADYLAKPLEADSLEAIVRKNLPPEKVHDEEPGCADDGVMEFEASGADSAAEDELPEAVWQIEGLDVEDGLLHTGGSEALYREILTDIATGGHDAAKDLLQSAAMQDYEQYRITAHSIKGLMATIGAGEMSTAAKRQEYAARNGEYVFIGEHCRTFAQSYEDLCSRILKALRDDV